MNELEEFKIIKFFSIVKGNRNNIKDSIKNNEYWKYKFPILIFQETNFGKPTENILFIRVESFGLHVWVQNGTQNRK